MHVHRNTPGILARIIDIFAGKGFNIVGQFLQTQGELGYVVVELDAVPPDTRGLLAELRALHGTIRARVLYVRD